MNANGEYHAMRCSTQVLFSKSTFYTQSNTKPNTVTYIEEEEIKEIKEILIKNV